MADLRRTRSRRRLKILFGVAAAAALTACAAQPYPEIPRDAPSGGQRQDELAATLTGIEGLTVLRAAGSEPNVKGNTGYAYDLALETGYRIADPVALLNFLVESAWSVRDGYMPNTSIEISLIGDPSEPIDLTVVGQEAGWVPPSRSPRGMADNGYTSVSVSVDTGTEFAQRNGGEANRERLGEWPGTAPGAPGGMIVAAPAGEE